MPCTNESHLQDNVFTHEVTLHDLNVIHDDARLPGPLRLRLSSSPRFIIHYRALRDQIAQLSLGSEANIAEAEKETDGNVEHHGDTGELNNSPMSHCVDAKSDFCQLFPRIISKLIAVPQLPSNGTRLTRNTVNSTNSRTKPRRIKSRQKNSRMVQIPMYHKKRALKRTLVLMTKRQMANPMKKPTKKSQAPLLNMVLN